MTSVCDKCGEDSLVFGNLSMFFPVIPVCMNKKCEWFGESQE